MIKKNKNPLSARQRVREQQPNKNKPFAARALSSFRWGLLGARLSQRVAMDDLASYFVEERSKVR